MNPIEKATQLGQKLFEIQTSAMTELANMQQQNMQNYAEMTRDFSSRLAEVRDPQALMELQREICLLYTSPSPRDATLSRMPSSA